MMVPEVVPPHMCQLDGALPVCLQDLLLSYNIGVDRVASRQQQLQRSARSVGWDLPEEDEEEVVQQEDQTRLKRL